MRAPCLCFRGRRGTVCAYTGSDAKSWGREMLLRLRKTCIVRVRTPHFGAERVWAQGIVAAHEPRRQGRVGARPGAGGQRRLPQGNRHQRGCHAGDLATLACASSITMQAKCHLLTELGTMRALQASALQLLTMATFLPLRLHCRRPPSRAPTAKAEK